MRLKIFKIFVPIILFLLISCEDRIFLEREPELILNGGVYTLESEGLFFDHVILQKDSILYTAIPCNEDNIITFFEIGNSGTYLISLIYENEIVFSKSVYLNEIHNELTEITVLDVSQGDSFIITPVDKKPSVIDGGYGTAGSYNWQDGRNPTLLNYLIDNSISNLKYIIQTHDDADHYGGLNDVIADGTIDHEKYFTNDSEDLPAVNDTLFFSEDVYGIMFHYGNLSTVPDSVETEENNRSITLKLVYKDFEMLFTADIEAEVEDYLLQQSYFLQDTNYDILKVPHHGSSSSSTIEFLEQVCPKLSVISCGEGNPWGHPTELVQERLWDNSNAILRTDLNGDIKILTDGISFQTISEK